MSNDVLMIALARMLKGETVAYVRATQQDRDRDFSRACEALRKSEIYFTVNQKRRTISSYGGKVDLLSMEGIKSKLRDREFQAVYVEEAREIPVDLDDLIQSRIRPKKENSEAGAQPKENEDLTSKTVDTQIVQ